jgi:hypothetical protein
LNILGAGSVRQTELHTAKLTVPHPSASEVDAEVATVKLKRYKSQSGYQIPAEKFKQKGKHCILRSINLLN